MYTHSVEGLIPIIRSGVEWRVVSGLLVPLAVIIVGHDSYPVKVFGYYGHVVTLRDDALVRRYGRRQKETAWLELGAQLDYELAEAFLIGFRALRTVDL